MSQFRLQKNQCVAINGVRHEYLGDDKKGRALFRNYVTMALCGYAKDLLVTMYNSGTFRFLTFSEAYDAVPMNKLPIVVEDLESLPKRDVEQVKRKAEYVRALNGVRKGEHWERRVAAAIDRTAALLGDSKQPSLQSIYRWRKNLSNWDGDPRALAPAHKRKGNAQSKIQPDVLEALEAKIKELYLRPNPMTLKEVHEATLIELQAKNRARTEAGVELLPFTLNYKTVLARARKISPHTIVKSQHGHLAGERMLRGGGTSIIIGRPLQRVEIDHTQLDLVLVDNNRLPLGRPHLTAVIDVYSRAILGFHVSFRSPSQHAIFECLRMAISPKTFLKAPASPYIDIENDWPMHGIPVEIAHDAGKDFLGKSFSHAAFELGIQLNQLPVLRPWLKGAIERVMGSMNRGAAGAVPGHTLGRNENAKLDNRYNAEKSAVLTFDEFLYLLVHWIVDVYHETQHSSTLETPRARWENGVKDYPPRLPTDARHLNIVLAHRREGTITDSGIWMHGLNYSSPELAELREHLADDRKVNFKFSESDISMIYVYSNYHRRYLEVPCRTPAAVEGLSYFQFHVVRRRAQREAGQGNELTLANLFRAKEKHFEQIREAALSTKIANRRIAAIHEVVESNVFKHVQVEPRSDAVITSHILQKVSGDVKTEAQIRPLELATFDASKDTANGAVPVFSARQLSSEEKQKLLERRKKS